MTVDCKCSCGECLTKQDFGWEKLGQGNTKAKDHGFKPHLLLAALGIQVDVSIGQIFRYIISLQSTWAGQKNLNVTKGGYLQHK